MKGTVLAATFSWGCERANQLGITPILREYALSQGKSHKEEEIRGLLQDLFSYLYYQIIARANQIEDPLDIQVVKAHWIGNELLEKVQKVHIKEVFEKEKARYDKIVLAKVLEGVIKTGSAHHNAYCHYNPECSVISDGEYLWHLGVKRIKASPEDLKNLAKYGRK